MDELNKDRICDDCKNKNAIAPIEIYENDYDPPNILFLCDYCLITRLVNDKENS